MYVVVAAAAFAAAGLAVAVAMWDRTPDVIKIGVGQPLTGNLAALGQDMLNGVQMAADEINAAGGVRIGSKRVKLEVVSADDKSNADVGVAAAQRLVDAGVLVAVAHLNSGVSIAAAPVYAKAQVPQLAISTKPAYTQLGLPTTLRIVANDDLQSQAIGAYAAQLPDAKRFAVIDDGTPYGKGLADSAAMAIAKVPGAEVGVRLSLDDKTTQFTAVIESLRTAKSDVIVTTLSDFQVEALIRQLAKAGMERMRILGGDTIKTDKLLSLGGVVQGVYATSPIIEPREFANGKPFLAAFRGRFHGDPVYGAHYAYDAVYLVANALERNGSVDRAKLLERLKAFDGNAPVTGSMRFREDGEQRYGAIAVYQLRAGQWMPLMRSDRW
jgi:branched-chain amino acid transport system substrate-binding protein